jgi:hypothetical protein
MQPGRILDQVDADQEPAAVQSGTHAPEQGERGIGAEIADGAAGKETGAARAIRQDGNVQRPGKVADHGPQRQGGIVGCQALHHVREIVAGNIQRGIGAGAFQCVQQDAHFAQTARAELHDLDTWTHQRGDLAGMACQKHHLGAGLVIFRQIADRIEQA